MAKLLQSNVPRSRSAGQLTSNIPIDVTVIAGPTALQDSQPSKIQCGVNMTVCPAATSPGLSKGMKTPGLSERSHIISPTPVYGVAVAAPVAGLHSTTSKAILGVITPHRDISEVTLAMTGETISTCLVVTVEHVPQLSLRIS